MNGKIEIVFDKKIKGYVITMPNFITLEMIEEWKEQFDEELNSSQNNSRYSLLIDTNKHQFELIECLKSLRDYLSSKPDFQHNIIKASFVSPPNFRQPQIVSDVEAYFDNYEKAYQWLHI